jgi:hypothetical protein
MCEPHAQKYNLTMNGYLDTLFSVSPSLLSLETMVYKLGSQIHHTYPLFFSSYLLHMTAPC